MRMWASILTVVFTGLTALFAGFLWWETYIHDVSSVKPTVDFVIGNDPADPPVGIGISNYGPGTAIIKSITFFVDRKSVSDVEEAGTTYGHLSDAELDYNEFDPGDALPVGPTFWLIRYRKPRGAKINQNVVDKFADFVDQHLAIEVIFCSIRGECWSPKCSTKGRCE
jgi:hypothetical protein